MTTPAPKLITGVKYQSHCRTPQRVTGWLVQRPNLNGKSLSTDNLVPVTLLTAEGERFRNVLVRVIDILHTEPRNFANFSDHMLWRVAETDMGGLGERVLAELAYRESQEIQSRQRAHEAELAVSRRSADALMGRV
jgi:hypothetical protein